MNRTFTAPLTPSRARLIVELAKHARVNIDPELEAVAQRDMIPDETLAEHDIDDPADRAVIQFIHDMNFRCGIPAKAESIDKCEQLLGAALKIAQVTNIMVSSPISSRHFADFKQTELSPTSAVPHRHKPAIINLDSVASDSQTLEIISKLYPRLILYGTMMIQYALSIGTQTSTTKKMGEILYPSVADNIDTAPLRRNSPSSLLMLGVNTRFIQDINFIDTTKRPSFCVPETIKY